MSLARIEITTTGHDERGRRVFEVVLHGTDGARRSVYEGGSYSNAISAAESWEGDGAEVVDTVTAAVDIEIDTPPRVPAAWTVVETVGTVNGLHVEVWRRTGTDRAIVAVSPVPVPGGFVAAISGSMATLDLLRFSAPSVVVTLQAARAAWAQDGAPN